MSAIIGNIVTKNIFLVCSFFWFVGLLVFVWYAIKHSPQHPSDPSAEESAGRSSAKQSDQ